MEQPKKILVKKESTNNPSSLTNVYSGDIKNHPGVLKAQSDKRKADESVADYKKKAESVKKKIMVKVKKK